CRACAEEFALRGDDLFYFFFVIWHDVGLIALPSSCPFGVLHDPTLRSFVAHVGLLALRASCPFGTAQGKNFN
ncbi:MAG: hypothetical protein J6P54_07010, partial [Bacteroidales bacterium]|nr:hypothetical protein [Bacteroidales bacterium]